MARIFISYKHEDFEKVFKIKEEIKNTIGEESWIDLKGIDYSTQFVSVICTAIDEAEIVLFMYSKAHTNIDFEDDWTIKELDYARRNKKRIILVKLDHTPLFGYFSFMFGSKNNCNSNDPVQFNKLLNEIAIDKQDKKRNSHEISENSKFCPDCGNKFCKFTIDNLFPIKGLTLGVSTLSDAKNMGFEVREDFVVDSGFSAEKYSDNPDVLSFFLVDVDTDDWPAHWNKIGLKNNLSFDDLLDLCEKMGMRIDINVKAYYNLHNTGGGYYSIFIAYSPDNSFSMQFEFVSENEANATSKPNSLITVSICTETE